MFLQILHCNNNNSHRTETPDGTQGAREAVTRPLRKSLQPGSPRSTLCRRPLAKLSGFLLAGLSPWLLLPALFEDGCGGHFLGSPLGRFGDADAALLASFCLVLFGMGRWVRMVFGGSESGHAQKGGLTADDLLRRMDQRDAWDRFYSEKGASGPQHFDWFFGYRDVSGLLLSTLQGLPSGEARILDVGCGTSALGLGLYRDSPRQLHVSCLDFSPLALDSLHQLLWDSPPPRHPLSQLCCHLADATDLRDTFESGSFHLVLDKGTCDTLLRCPQGSGRAKQLVAECLRVLRPGGKLLQFSDEDPDARVPFLEQAGSVGVTITEVGHVNGVCYYAYTLVQRLLDSMDSRQQSPEGKGLKSGPGGLD